MIPDSQPQPEEVMPNGPDISHGTPVNAAPQGSNPPAGAAETARLRDYAKTLRGIRDKQPPMSDAEMAAQIAAHQPLQPTGGTPEVDALFPNPGSIAWDEFIEAHAREPELEPQLIEAVKLARTLERQRNEARAALAAAESDKAVYWGQLQESRESLAAAQAEVEKYKARLEISPQGDDKIDELESAMGFIRAELEQTRRERDELEAAIRDSVTRHEMRLVVAERDQARQALTAAEQELAAIETGTLVKLLRERLTAAEERADGAEERAQFLAKNSANARTWIEVKKDNAALTAQRDTALRERDEADSLAKLQREAREWADATFPHSDDRARLKHIEKEVQELLQEPADGEEMADILLILSHHAHRHGVDLLSAARAKFEKCKLRKWGKPDADGVCQHISEGAAALAAKTTEGGERA